MNERAATGSVFLVAVVGATVAFVLTTAAMDTLPDSVLVGMSLVVALAVVSSLGGWRTLVSWRTVDRQAMGLALGGGILALWAAPMLALSQRASDAPSGADTLFFTTTVWGLLCVAGAYLIVRERQALTGLAGAVCAAAGAAGLLASWEYPSSFSPFAKFPVREALMVVAGVLFAAGALALSEAVRRTGTRATLALAIAAAAAIGLLGCLPALPAAISGSALAWRYCVYLGVTVAVFYGAWVWLAEKAGAARASSTLLLAPPMMAAISIYERATVAYGPNPFETRGVLAGTVAVLCGTLVVWLSAPRREAQHAVRGPVSTAAVWVAGVSAVLAVVSLGTPALSALSQGHVTESFRVAWTMAGLESAAGWMPVAGSLLALSAALEARKGQQARTWLAACATVIVCALASWPLAATTLHTWNRWIPAEIQQTYGTEYARLSVEAILDPTRVAALALAVVSVLLLGVAAALSRVGVTGPQEAGQSDVVTQ